MGGGKLIRRVSWMYMCSLIQVTYWYSTSIFLWVTFENKHNKRGLRHDVDGLNRSQLSCFCTCKVSCPFFDRWQIVQFSHRPPRRRVIISALRVYCAMEKKQPSATVRLASQERVRFMETIIFCSLLQGCLFFWLITLFLPGGFIFFYLRVPHQIMVH